MADIQSFYPESDEAIDRMIEYLRLKWDFIDKNLANL